MRKVYKVLQNITKHNFGSNGVEWMDFFKIIFTTSVSRNSAFGLETQVSRQFTFRRILKFSKHSQTSLLSRGIKMDAFGGK
jgi:hypothetical protein